MGARIKMTVPPPRLPQDAPDREAFLATIAALYDRLREGSRAQLHHAALMAERQLGGAMWIHLPSKASKRHLPEAGYTSEAPPGVHIR
jgi:hypothetical protein